MDLSLGTPEIGRPLFVLSRIVPRNFVAMRPEVIEGAARPGHGETETLFGAGAISGVFGALVESHDNVGAESDLNVDGVLGRKKVRAPIEMRAKADTVVRNFSERAEGENLEAAGVGEDGARPAHEFVKPAHAADRLVAGAQIEVIGIAEDDFSAESFERVLRDGFDGSLRANGHEHWCLDGLVRQDETSTAPAGGGFGQDLELQAH